MELFHGSNQFVDNPHVIDNPRNDFGRGLYLCDTFDKTAEWACGRFGASGVVTTYQFDGFTKFDVLDFLDGQHNIFEWLATMMYYRWLDLTDDLKILADFLIKNFAIDLDPYDIVIGYRADDGYFVFVSNFLTGQFDIDGLKQAMSRGLLGEQIVMKTQRAHDALYDPNATYFDYSNMLPYFKADGQRISNANQAVRNINSHRNYHFYDLMNAYEDLSNIEDAMQYSDDLTLDEEYESLQQLINDIISEARIGRK